MSIYATLWRLQFPSEGDDFLGCDWVEVVAQGVPAHIGTPSPGHGYEEGEYTSTLLVLPGEEYARTSFEALHERICAALRGSRPRVVAQVLTPDGWMELIREEEQLEH